MNTKMIFQLLGGLGLFIYGMRIMGTGLQQAAGSKLKKLLEILTKNRFLGVLVGALITVLIQSSSATTVMVVGFVNAGLMSLVQAAGVIMGANIGTTITAQIVAFKLTDIAPIIVAIGVPIYLFAPKKKYRQIGEILTGFGILFIGMQFMSASMKPLRGHQAFADRRIFLGQNRFLGVLAGFLLTAIVQSSSASIGMLQALASNNLITLNIALPILLGQNIGTCVTALLSSIGTNVTAKRAAVIHLIFNIIGTGIFILITGPVIKLVGYFGGDTMRQIANAHTFFNITNTIVQLPFIALLVMASMKLVKGKEEDEENGVKYLDKRLLETPSIAVVQAEKEVVRMGRVAQSSLKKAVKGFISEDEKILKSSLKKEVLVNLLEREIIEFLAILYNSELSLEENATITGMLHIVNDIERIGDHAENIVELAQHKIDNDLILSDDAQKELQDMIDYVNSMAIDVITALENNDFELADGVWIREERVDQMEKKLRENHMERLNKGKCMPLSGIVFLDVISNLERVADHCSNISTIVLEKKK